MNQSGAQEALNGQRLMEAIRRLDAGQDAHESNEGMDLDQIIAFVTHQAARPPVGGGRQSDPLPRWERPLSNPWRPVAKALQTKSEYALGELLAHSDADFITTAYACVLRRAADAGGLAYYLEELRAGRMTKVEILAALRWSQEGESKGVHIDGLLAPFLLQKWRRKRYIGPVVRWLHSMARIGQLWDRQIALDASHAWEAQEIGRVVNDVTETIERRLGSFKTMASLMDVDAVRAEAHHIGDMARVVQDDVTAISGSLAQHNRRLDDLKGEVSTLFEALVVSDVRLGKLEQSQAAMAEVVESLVPKPLPAAEPNALDELYANFEDAYRGSSELIRRRVEPYLADIRAVNAGTPDARVVDIGCGRGEWLGMLREEGLACTGIDTNRVFVQACRDKGLDVIEGDAIEALGTFPRGSIGAITSMHLVEHLPFESVVELIDRSLKALKPGGALILETPNPENIMVGAHWFYMDPTHRNPLSPGVLRWLVEARGFSEVRIERLFLGRDREAPPLLGPEIPGAESINAVLKHMHAATDFAIIGIKP